jgi:hypothetical protein
MTSKELKESLGQTSKIVVDLHISLNNANRLFENKYENEDEVKKHGFFKHHYYQLWFILSIQLSKLLSNSRTQKFNFNKLLSRLETEDLDKEILTCFELNQSKPFVKVYKSKTEMCSDIQRLKEEILEHYQTIEKVLKSRDTLYAHRDPNSKPQELKLEDVEELVAVCCDIYNSLNGGIYDTFTNFKRTIDWNIDYVLKECSHSRALKKRGK